MFTGVQVLAPRFLDRIPASGQQCVVRTAYSQLHAEGGAFAGFVTDAYWWEHSTRERYLQGVANVIEGRARVAHAPGPVRGVDPHAQIDATARVDPMTWIGPRVRVGAGAEESVPVSSSAPAWSSTPASACATRSCGTTRTSPATSSTRCWPAERQLADWTCPSRHVRQTCRWFGPGRDRPRGSRDRTEALASRRSPEITRPDRRSDRAGATQARMGP